MWRPSQAQLQRRLPIFRSCRYVCEWHSEAAGMCVSSCRYSEAAGIMCEWHSEAAGMCVRGCQYPEADIQELIFRSRYSEAAGMCVSGIQKLQVCV